MRVGIVEICVKEHYMVVNAVLKTYSSQTSNEVYVFTLAEAVDLIQGGQDLGSNVHFVIMDATKPVADFLNQVEAFNLDRVHLTTVTKYFKAFYHFKPKTAQLFFHFHNIDLWFESAISIQAKRLWKAYFIDKIKFEWATQIKYSVKDIFRDIYRKKFIKRLAKDKAKWIVLSEAQKKVLSQYIDVSNAIVFPTLVFEPNLHQDLSVKGAKLRICIPGSVTQVRREYEQLFNMIELNFDWVKTHFSFDLLGFVPPNETHLLERIKALESNGLAIDYYTSFLEVKQFDLNLYAADILLSNLLLDQNEAIQTKETATVFHMVRGVKPGIFPQAFQLDSDLEASVIKFKDYQDLLRVFHVLIDEPEQLIALKQKAESLSKSYTPEYLYKRLS